MGQPVRIIIHPQLNLSRTARRIDVRCADSSGFECTVVCQSGGARCRATRLAYRQSAPLSSSSPCVSALPRASSRRGTAPFLPLPPAHLGLGRCGEGALWGQARVHSTARTQAKRCTHDGTHGTRTEGTAVRATCASSLRVACLCQSPSSASDRSQRTSVHSPPRSGAHCTPPARACLCLWAVHGDGDDCPPHCSSRSPAVLLPAMQLEPGSPQSHQPRQQRRRQRHSLPRNEIVRALDPLP
jgi:hypothetical protein